MSLVSWYSKKQSTIVNSVFGSEFVAIKVAMEKVRGLRYKLRMTEIPLGGPTYMYGDNISVIQNTQRPESTINKKSLSLAYHDIRESVAMNELRTGHMRSGKNPGNLVTKIHGGSFGRNRLVSKLLYDLAD